jgi:glycosyltransferase involved in cell wall biosynthesis
MSNEHSAPGTAGRPDVSVIIPTWNRSELLRQTLEALAAQTAPPESFEAIVVDDGSSDGTDVMIRELQARLPFRLGYHRMAGHGGPVLARNQGARLSHAALLAFTDSDCEPTPRWIATAIAAFEADPGLGFLAGPAISNPRQRVRFFSIGGADCQGEHRTYPAANVIYRADVFAEVGGFDPSAWIRNAGATPLDFSDTDLAWRVRERGHSHLFHGDLVVHHAVRQLSPWDWLLHYTRLTTIPELVRRHPTFGKAFLWWGRFCLPENPLFYLALAGFAVAVAGHPLFLLLGLPLLVRMARLLSRASRVSVARIPIFACQVALLALRQAVMCGSLIYGSIRARTLVV